MAAVTSKPGLKPTPAFVAHCVELLQPLGLVRTKRMFGGWGLYVDEIFIAVIAFDRLYLKVDEQSRPAFDAEGCEPFVYDSKNGSVSLGYWTAPADALDSPALMLPWARRALQAALAARACKPAAKPATKPRSR
jgi:DNA transformation protein and related proteins